MYILGINAYHGDASAALIRDGELLIALEEERLNRVKHCAGFPAEAVRACLAEAGIGIEAVDHVAISRDPSAQLKDRILHALSKVASNLKMVKDRLSNVSKVRDVKASLAEGLGIEQSAIRAQLHHVEHHQAHMASAFFVSPFEEAALASIDGFGDFCSTMIGKGSGHRLEVLDRVTFPHSLGVFYTMVTQFLGFRKYGDEGKVMGLAPYGKPVFLSQMERIVEEAENGAFRLNTDYFRHHSEGVEMSWDQGSPVLGMIFSQRMVEEFGEPREPGTPLTEREENLAASLQKCLEERILRLLNHLAGQVPSRNLCLAGGVTLNSVTNGLIRSRTPFEEVYVQAAAGDNGTSLGAAYFVHHQVLDQPRSFVMEHAYTGPALDRAACVRALQAAGLAYEQVEDIEARTARLVADGQVVGWFQGAMEFGPRALGNRSIVADPRRPDMKDILNARIKHREPFRPFAPSILEEYTGEWFEDGYPSPFMLMVYKFKEDKRAKVPAVNHVDDTGRLQTVSRKTNPRYWTLIDEFRKLTDVPLILNTSFNENEPIVCTPEDAIRCFTTTDMDALILDDLLVQKA